MAINPILQNAVIQRGQDMSIVKHNVDQKGTVDQSNIQHGLQKTEEQKSTQVIKKDDAQMGEGKFDAHGDGGNAYQGDGGQKRKKQTDQQGDGRVIAKKAGGFDIKV